MHVPHRPRGRVPDDARRPWPLRRNSARGRFVFLLGGTNHANSATRCPHVERFDASAPPAHDHRRSRDAHRLRNRWVPAGAVPGAGWRRRTRPPSPLAASAVCGGAWIVAAPRPTHGRLRRASLSRRDLCRRTARTRRRDAWLALDRPYVETVDMNTMSARTRDVTRPPPRPERMRWLLRAAFHTRPATATRPADVGQLLERARERSAQHGANVSLLLPLDRSPDEPADLSALELGDIGLPPQRSSEQGGDAF